MTAPASFADPAVEGSRVRWTWNGAPGDGLPTGVVVDHGDHDLLVPWVPFPGGPERVFTLDSLFPLTVVEQVRCGLCSAVGRIEQGAWLPSKGGAS